MADPKVTPADVTAAAKKYVDATDRARAFGGYSAAQVQGLEIALAQESYYFDTNDPNAIADAVKYAQDNRIDY